jgi:hypothetical protein
VCFEISFADEFRWTLTAAVLFISSMSQKMLPQVAIPSKTLAAFRA